MKRVWVVCGAVLAVALICLIALGLRREALGEMLIDAAVNGKVGEIRSLARRGADLEWTAEDGTTPLAFATENGHAAAVDVLLSLGADPHDANFNHVAPVDVVQDDEVRRVYLKHGIRVTISVREEGIPGRLGAR